jgi:outer membrane protein TolC
VLAVALAALPAIARATPLVDDPGLLALRREAREHRPELRELEARIAATRERAVASGTLPDPVLSLGLQNDGFTALRIGMMETSYVAIMAAQTFPTSGKRALAASIGELQAARLTAERRRLELSINAELERGYVQLLWLRAELQRLDELDSSWAKASQLARVRYEAGTGAQTDLLCASLELSRLKQRRMTLSADERRQVASPLIMASTRHVRAGQWLPSTWARSGLIFKPSTARCMANRVAWRMLMVSISPTEASAMHQASAHSFIWISSASLRLSESFLESCKPSIGREGSRTTAAA